MRRVYGRRAAILAITLGILAACTGELTSPTEPLRLLATSLPAVFVSERVDLPLRPTGGLRPYSFTVVDGRLPPGLSVAGGRLAGTPSVEGRFAFTIEVTDANLNRTVQRLEVLVRPLPLPALRIDAPTTDVEGPTALRLRLHEGRGWRGAKVELTWDADAFALDEGSVRAANDSLATFWEYADGTLRVDVATLGGALDGEHALLRFTLMPVARGRLGLGLASEHRYVGGHHFETSREGAPVSAPAQTAPGGGAVGPEDPDGLDDFDDPGELDDFDDEDLDRDVDDEAGSP
ncbi:hypothetical protein BH23DEI1_BH23DEI1_13280 [soil metagenome]